MEKIITTSAVYKHPYKWNVRITWGTKEEMLANKHYSYNNKLVYIGGSFNKKLDDCGKRAALVQIALRLENGEYVGIRENSWEGTYCYLDEFYPEMKIDENIKKGLYPVSIDMDGGTLIERWKSEGKTWKQYYEQVETWRY